MINTSYSLWSDIMSKSVTTTGSPCDSKRRRIDKSPPAVTVAADKPCLHTPVTCVPLVDCAVSFGQNAREGTSVIWSKCQKSVQPCGLYILRATHGTDVMNHNMQVYNALESDESEGKSWTGLKHDNLSLKAYTGTQAGLRMLNNRYRRVWGRSKDMALLTHCPSLINAREVVHIVLYHLYPFFMCYSPITEFPFILPSTLFLFLVPILVLTPIMLFRLISVPPQTMGAIVASLAPLDETISAKLCGHDNLQLLTEQLIKYHKSDCFFNLHWDIDTKDTAEPIPHNLTGSELGPGEVFARVGPDIIRP